MMTKEYLKDALKFLKKKGIQKGDVAKELAITQGYLSDILGGRKTLTNDFDQSFKRSYGTYLIDFENNGSATLSQAEKDEKVAKKMPGSIDYQAEFAEAMKTIRGYNNFLQDMLKSSLSILLEGQGGHSALLGLLLRRDIDREAGGSQDKAQEILKGILQKIGPKLNSDLKDGIGADGHSGDKGNS